MGLQFIDANGNERTLTEADMLLPDFQESYSDLYKGLHGFRPRGHDAATMLRFFDTYEQAFAEEEAREAALLKDRSARDGVEYRSWSHYYDVQEEKMEAEYRRESEAREAEEEAKRAAAHERTLRGGIIDTIDDWDHGDSIV